jgi:tetratricopeptide (TPR) repeat protein
MYSEGRRRLEAALDGSCRASVLVRARALRGAGILAQLQGDYRSAQGILREAVRLFDSTNDTEGTAFAYRDLGWTLYRLRSPEEALHAFWMSRALAEQIRDDYLVALCRLGIGSICRERGQVTEALEHFTRSLEVLRARGDRENEANALGNIGTAHFQNGALEEARRHYLEAMRIEIELGDVAGLTIAYNNLGDIHMRLGEHDRASEFYDKLAQIAEETGSSSFLSVAYGGMAECALAMQSYTEALTYAKLSSRAAEEQGNTLYRAASLRVLGETHLACEDYEHARECLAEAVRLLEGMPGAEEELEKARRGYQLTEEHAARPPPEGAS